MSSPARRTILIYGLAGMELLKLAKLCKEAGIRCKAVSSAQTTLTVSQLLSENPPQASESFPLNGKYALLDGFGSQIDDAARIINQVSSGVIKAVHTAHNSNWRFADLCFAIRQEQNVIENIKKQKKK